jgi:hypothetical protein
MKFIPDGIGRKLGQQGLLASEHAPKVLFVGGVVGMVGSTVLACSATLKLEGVLDEIEDNKRKAEGAKQYVDENNGTTPSGATYTEQEYKKDLYVISVRGAGRIAKLYAPSVALGGLSIFALTKSHHMLLDRNLALTAAYTAVNGAFERYRGRVVDRFGEEVDEELRYESEQIDEIDEETGELTSRIAVTGAPGSAYARWFDSESSTNWSRDPDTNVLFLRSVQNYANDRLHSRGHIFLNEVLQELGLSHTRAGAVVGWRYNKGSGDDVVDFGCWEGTRDGVKGLFNGRDGAILLDFNVDGFIQDKIDEEVI